jgi:hypothetical protein
LGWVFASVLYRDKVVSVFGTFFIAAASCGSWLVVGVMKAKQICGCLEQELVRMVYDSLTGLLRLGWPSMEKEEMDEAIAEASSCL